MQTALEWINHASFLVHAPDTRLLVDPWFTGSVFDEGWDLLCETPRFAVDDLTDLWISHEHPDHFHPPTLRSLPTETRARMRFWYQHTRDGKVAAYVRALGFRSITECRRGRWYELGPEVRLRVEPWGVFDSILVLQTPDATIVDLNDCKTRGAWSPERLARRLRNVQVDVLITQVEAGDDVDMLVDQVRALGAATVVPGASFVWFSHEENAHHNDGASRIDRAWRRLQERVDAEVVVLYPGDVWKIGTEHETLAALERYAQDYARLAVNHGVHRSASVEPEKLAIDAAMWGSRLRSVNGERMLSALRVVGALQPATVWLQDYGAAYALSSEGITLVDQPAATCDVALSSSALDAVFTMPWGGNTLSVNGRAQYPPGGSPARFRRWAALGSYNNHGFRIGQMLPRLAGDALRRRLARVGKGATDEA